MDNNLQRTIDLEKGRLLKNAIKIIDKLADNDLGDIDGDISTDDFDIDELHDLILEARKLKRHRFWKLK